MNAPNFSALLTNWPIEPPFVLTSLAGGTNNHTYLVKTEEKTSSYVLRLMSGTVNLSHVRYEAALLEALQRTSLPFQLPSPRPTHRGDYFVLVEQEQAEPLIATLTPFLAGSIPERNILTVTKVGTALAQLDAALATIPVASLPARAEEGSFLYGDLFHCHPLIPDPFIAIERLLAPEQAQPLSAILRQTQHDWERLTAQNLPQHLVHRDCGPGNVLMENGQVTAMLDFEFADVDRRLFDLCVALSWWPVRLMGTGQEWPLIDALGQAYTAHYPLTEEELLALPSALRMRDTTSLIYRIGRYLAGLETEQTLLGRVQHSLWREDWLLAQRETLMQHALAWKPSQDGPRSRRLD